MSKKCNKGAKKNKHANDLLKERQAIEKRDKKIKKREARVAVGAVQKHKATKPIRIRKGVRVKGITIVDSDTKKRVKKLIKADKAAKMDIDQRAGKKKTLLKGAVQKKKGAPKKHGAAVETMGAEMVMG